MCVARLLRLALIALLWAVSVLGTIIAITAVTPQGGRTVVGCTPDPPAVNAAQTLPAAGSGTD